MAMAVIIIIDNDDAETTRTTTPPSDGPRRRIRTDNGFIILLEHTKLQCAFAHADTQTPRDGRAQWRERERGGERTIKMNYMKKLCM